MNSIETALNIFLVFYVFLCSIWRIDHFGPSSGGLNKLWDTGKIGRTALQDANPQKWWQNACNRINRIRTVLPNQSCFTQMGCVGNWSYYYMKSIIFNDNYLS